MIPGLNQAARLIPLAVFSLLLASVAVAQEQEPNTGTRYFGAPVVKYTTIRDQGAMMVGGRGGWNIASSWLVGGGLYGTVSEVDAQEKAVPEAPGPLDVKLEAFGLDLEYAARPTAPIHLTLSAFCGGAAVRYAKDKTDEQFGETDFMLLVEPVAGVEFRGTNWLHLNLGLSYRFVSGVEQPGLTAGDLHGAAVSLALKFGRF